ncbi:hypothetical protein KPB2_5445 [Klebsiella pneumoniae Kb677]|nr:hypothetical protein KPB2_5445 [Klebsiella pneumoniae Kb677]
MKGWPDTIVVRQREQIPGVWDRHNASGEKTVVVDCRNATAEIKELFQQFSHSSHGPGSQLPGYPTKTGHADHLLPRFLLLQLLLQRMKVCMTEHDIFPLPG